MFDEAAPRAAADEELQWTTANEEFNKTHGNTKKL
jgi:hypothetical protein